MAVVVSSSEAPSVSEDPRDAERPCFPTPRQLFLLLVGYFTLQLLIRTFLSGSVDLDESEQVMLSQKLSFGYSSDPPIYTWIQTGLFAVFGRGVFALALLKDVLLLATYGLVYASARTLTRSHQCGAAAALSLLFVPHIVWESQRDLTHTVLASMCAAGALFCFLQAHETKRTEWYAGLGLCFGVGFLAKYNFVFWGVGLLLAALSLPEFRSSVLNRRMLVSLGIGLVLVLPNVLWVMGHRELATRTTNKLGIEGSSAWLKVVWTGFRHIAQAVMAFLGPPTLVYLLVFLKAPKTAEPRPGAAGAKLILRTFLLILGLLVLLVLCFRATGFRERWFQPMLVCAPVLGIALVRERLDPRRLRWLSMAGLVVMVVVAVGIPGRILLMERLHREEPLARPYAELAQEIKPVLPEHTLLVTDTMVLGGNLLLSLPEQRVATPEMTKLLDNGSPHGVLVWDATQHDEPPEALADWAQGTGTTEWSRAPRRYFSATYRFHRERRFRIGMVQVY